MIDAKPDRHVEPERLSAWIDDDLPPEEAQQIARHLELCSECQGLVADLRAIREAAGALNEEAQAPGWASVAARLPQGRRSRTAWIGVAAAAALLLALGALLWIRQSGGGADVAVQRARVELARLQRQQQRTIDALLPLVQKRRSQWDPGLDRTFENNLSLVDAAIRECQRALTRRPRDLTLRTSLAAAYQRKVDLLELFGQSDGDDR